MKKKTIDENIVRVGPGAMNIILKNKSKGVYYCEDEDGYIIVDSRNGKPKQYKCATLNDCMIFFDNI